MNRIEDKFEETNKIIKGINENVERWDKWLEEKCEEQIRNQKIQKKETNRSKRCGGKYIESYE